VNVQVDRIPGKSAGPPPGTPLLEHRMRKFPFWAATLLAAVVACNEAPFSTPETGEATAGPALSADHTGRSTVVVNPDASGNGVAATIQEGIDMAASGGRVLIRPGHYPEVVFVTKGVTLEPLGDVPGPVVVEPPGNTVEGIEIVTTEPVMIRGLTVLHTGNRGIFGFGSIDLTVEGVHVVGPTSVGIGVLNDLAIPLPPARLIVRDSRIEMSTLGAATFGIFAGGAYHAEIERNLVRSPGFLCVEFRTRRDGGGAVSGWIRGNDLDLCGGGGAIRVGRDFTAGAGNPPSTATGSVDVLDNVLRNSSSSCAARVGVLFEILGGRIENNDIRDYVQPCAIAAPRAFQAAIMVGSRFPMAGATPTVRLNDVRGNAHAGVRITSTITAALNAACNWWGTTDGPSGIGGGSGDALLVDGAAPLPTYTPFATAPIAGTGATGC
jgi:hypothetical protein